MVSIRLVSAVADWVGWQWAFLVVLPGPVLGVQAMLALMQAEDDAGRVGTRGMRAGTDSPGRSSIREHGTSP